MYAAFLEKPIVVIQNLFNTNDCTEYYFVAYDMVDFNPSNNQHLNVIRKAKCINSIISNPTEFDANSFRNEIDNLPFMTVTFPNTLKWTKLS